MEGTEEQKVRSIFQRLDQPLGLFECDFQMTEQPLEPERLNAGKQRKSEWVSMWGSLWNLAAVSKIDLKVLP
jgi:hypothetical protein